MVHWIFPKARIFPDLPARATKSVHFVRFNVVDPGYVVDPGAYSAPDQPHNPFPPRYFPSSRDEGTVA
jgi:hypothetical protein